MKRLFRSIQSFLKQGMKTVLHSKTEYLCFFLALIAIQSVLWSALIASHVRRVNAYQTISTNYDYHIEVRNLNEYAYATLYNSLGQAETLEDHDLDSYRFERASDGTYTAWIKVAQPLKRCAANIEFNYLRKLPGATVTYSPLYDFNAKYKAGIIWESVALCFVTTVFSVLILMWLYTIRLKHFSFMYGVYMTCGADFKRLYGTASSELAAVGILSFIPGALIGIGISAILYAQLNVPFSFSFWGLLIVPALLALIITGATYFPIRSLIKKTPLELIRTADNSFFVISPRNSKNILFKKFPSAYERISFVRFRKYYALLISGAVLFTSAFLCALFIARMQNTRAESARSEFTLTLSENIKTSTTRMKESTAQGYIDAIDELITDLSALQNVDRVGFKVSEYAPGLLAHMLLPPGKALNADSLIVSSSEVANHPIAFNRFTFVAGSRLYIQELIKQFGDQIEGDPELLLTTENAVILSESIAGSRAFTFKPGDTVYVALPQYDSRNKIVTKEGASADTTMFFTDREILNQQLGRYEFDYTALTVVAVIHDLETENYLSAVVSNDLYTQFTKSWPIATTLEIYPTSDASLPDIDQLNRNITFVLKDYNNWSKTANQAVLNRLLAGQGGMTYLIQIVAFALLVFSPLVWFFSQILFFNRRNSEWEMMESLGARRRQIRRTHIYNGLMTAFVALALSFALAYGLNYFIFWMGRTVLPSWGFTERFGYTFDLPLWQVLFCAGLSVLCGFLSAFIPYLKYRHKQTLLSNHRLEE